MKMAYTACRDLERSDQWPAALSPFRHGRRRSRRPGAVPGAWSTLVAVAAAIAVVATLAGVLHALANARVAAPIATPNSRISPPTATGQTFSNTQSTPTQA